jgi:hypothetical protein
MNRGFVKSFLGSFFSDRRPSFDGDRSFVYRTLVVPRNSRVIDSGRGANGISGLRERLSYRLLSLGWAVNKSRSYAFM